MNSNESFLKKLETDLETGNITTDDRRGILHHEKMAPVPDDWEIPDEVVNHDDLYASLEIKRIKQKSLFKKFFIASCVFALISGGVFAYSLFTGKARLTGENVLVNVQAKTFADSGEEVNVKVIVGNENPVPMEFATLTFTYPVGSTRDPGALKEITRDIGTINPGETKEELFPITLFGEQGTEKQFSATVEYRLQDSNAVFQKIGAAKLLLRSSLANLVVSGPDTILSGQELPLSLAVSGNATQTVSNALLVADYPDGCSFAQSTVPPTLDKNIWYIGDIAPGVTKQLPISITCNGNTNEEKVVTFSLGTQDPSNERLIQTIYTNNKQIIKLTAPFLATTISVNGKLNDGKISIPGNRDASIDIDYQSTADKPITDVEIRVALSGDAFDESKVRAGSGFYDSVTRSIVWTKNEWPQLAEIAPGQAGKLNFQITPLPLTGSGTYDMAISLNGVVFGGKQETLTKATTAKLGIATNLELLPKTLYYSGLLKNTGPMPMRAGKETTFTVVWSLANSTNPASNVVIKTTLPTGIVWKNIKAPVAQSGEITYNTVTREIVWSPGNVPVGQEAKSISFTLAVTPSNSQVGGIINLTNDIIMTGIDSVTQTPLSQTKRAQTSRLPNDTSKVGDDGKVLAP